MSQFFIGRPIFAIVLAIVVSLGGLLAIFTLPVEQYPSIAPPTITIYASYPGASAKTVSNAVTQIIEQQMTGLDNLLYIFSTSSSSGQVRIRLTFEAGTNPDIAQIKVQNKLQEALPSLPQQVRRLGVGTYQSGGNTFMLFALISENDKYSVADLGNFIETRLTDPLSRVKGVSQARNYASEYAMRIWLNPNKLYSYGLTPQEVIEAIRAENQTVAVGSLGALPPVPGQKLHVKVTVRGRLTSVEAFRNIIIKSTAEGATVRLKEVGRVELGSDEYDEITRFNGQRAAAIGLELAAGANSLATANRVKARMAELSRNFSPGIKATIAFQTAPYVKASIKQVVKTLFEAIVLVVIIIFLFLQSGRATLIPALAIPVVILGTFGVLVILGYSINTLTLFALVLAVGLLVDDAIVVIENVERVMSEHGLSPVEATRQSMREISSALVGIALVLSAVFLPMAFFPGATGVIYQQFSVTIIAAMVLSILVALILTPALCATILKPSDSDHGVRRLFAAVNRMLRPLPGFYVKTVGWMVRHRVTMLVIFAGLLIALGVLYKQLPSGFLPTEDKGVLTVSAQLPPGATVDRTKHVLSRVVDYFQSRPNVDSIFTIAGAQNRGQAWVILDDWSKRTGETRSAAAIAAEARAAFDAMIRDAEIYVRQPPTLNNVGDTAGFQLVLQDVGGVGVDGLRAALQKFIKRANANPKLTQVRSRVPEPAPAYDLDIDAAKARALGVPVDAINNTLSVALGGRYIGDFVYNGAVKPVYVQGAAPYRMLPKDIYSWYVESERGGMVPMSAFTSGSWETRLPELQRYNGKLAFKVVGKPAPGVSSGVAMATVAQLVADLPPDVGFAWTGVSFQQQRAGNLAPLLYGISILFVFLCLAALYESWSVPIAVMLVVPLGVLGTAVFTELRGLSAGVYFQVALLTTIGLAAKNAILIVEFAYSEVRAGTPVFEATLHAARLRLRPIVMTSLAFGMGVLPLAISSGAGAASQIAVGTGVLGGVTFATLLGIAFVPVFFVLTRVGLRRLDR